MKKTIALLIALSLIFTSTVLCFAGSDAFDFRGSLGQIDPSDIESITVLKVAAPESEHTVIAAPEIVSEEILDMYVVQRGFVLSKLWEASGKPYVNYAINFSDLDADDPNVEAIRWAASEKIILGYGDTVLGANDNITAEQFAVILYRLALSLGYDVNKDTENTNTLSFDDIFEVSSWASPAINWAVAAGILKPIENKVAPHSVVSGVRMAQMLSDFWAKVK